MEAGTHAERLASRILDQIQLFESGGIDLPDLQYSIQSNGAAMEAAPPELSAELRALDADLERIRFGVLREDQRQQVIERLQPLRLLLDEPPS